MEDDGKLPVTVAKNDTVAAHRRVSAAVELVSEWALLTAFGIAFAPALVVYILYYFHVHCTPVIKQPTVQYVFSVFALFVSSVLISARARAVLHCSAVRRPDGRGGRRKGRPLGRDPLLRGGPVGRGGAGAAAPIPPDPPRPSVRRAGGRQSAILGHCMYATGVRLVLAADPGYLFYRISCTIAIFILAVGDVVMTIVLFLGPGGED